MTKFLALIAASLALIAVASASNNLRVLQDPTTTSAPTSSAPGDPNLAMAQVFMLVDNLSFKQPLDGLCLAVSTLQLETEAEGDDNDMNVEGIMWINGRPATEVKLYSII